MRKVAFYISGFLVLSAMLSSCVSKKKFEELARAKRMSDREIANLQNEKQAMANAAQSAQPFHAGLHKAKHGYYHK